MKKNNPKGSPIVTFLGPDAGRGGPFALLGLPHSITSEQQIIQACQRRLQQIEYSRYRATPDADEVRQAIHAAGCQLLDPNLREQLAQRWPAGVPASVPQAWKRSKVSATMTPTLIRRAKLLIAGSGGWNPLARKRLAHFARVNRLSALDVVEALVPKQDTLPPLQSSSTQSPSPAANRPQASRLDPPLTTSPVWIVSYSLLAIISLSVVIGFVIAFKDSNRSEDHPNTIPSALADSTTNNPANSDPTSMLPRATLDHYTATSHELDVLVTQFPVNPSETIKRFPFVLNTYLDTWIQFPPPALTRSSLHIAELAKLIASQPKPFDWQSVLGRSSITDPQQLAIRAAQLDVILSEPSLPNQAKATLEHIRSDYPGITVQTRSNIIDSLSLVFGLLAVEQSNDDPQWWGRWIEGVQAIAGDQTNRLVLSAMTARIHDPAPSTKQWEQSAIKLVQAVSWRDKTIREWLLRQFANESVHTPRLAAITLAIAIHSGAEHIDATMALNPSSTFIQRQAIADRYRTAWQVNPSDSSLPSSINAQTQADELRMRLASISINLSQTEASRLLIDLTINNTIAQELVIGDPSLVEIIALDAELNSPQSQSIHQSTIKQSQQDTQWAQEAINVADSSQLAALSANLDFDTLGSNAAFALVNLATSHAQSEIRAQATIQVLRFIQHPAMLIALDHAIGSKRITSRTEHVLEQVVGTDLPDKTDPQWFAIVHSRLLNKLAQVQAINAATDLMTLEHTIAGIYSKRQTDPGPNYSALKGVISRFNTLDSAYQQALQTAPEIEHQYTLMLAKFELARSSARNPLQQYSAYQSACVTTLELLTQHTLPGSEYRIDSIEHEHLTRLNRAQSILDQMIQHERAIAQLWVIWLENNQIGGETDE
ncbi:MAG: hypothetical protein ACWA5W_02030 [Phycisphaerales bacterium]